MNAQIDKVIEALQALKDASVARATAVGAAVDAAVTALTALKTA